MLLLPLLVRGRALFVWSVVTASGLAGLAAVSFIPQHTAYSYIVIDAVAGFAVLAPWRRPHTFECKGIALLFAIMAGLEAGFAFSAGLNMDILVYTTLIIGWLQWALLFSWGLHEYYRSGDYSGGLFSRAVGHLRNIR